jgi:hypothetical protein
VVPQGLDVSFPFSLFCDLWSLFLGFFVRHLMCRFEGVSLWISLRGLWVSALCLFMDDPDPQTPDLAFDSLTFWWTLGHSVLGKDLRFQDL